MAIGGGKGDSFVETVLSPALAIGDAHLSGGHFAFNALGPAGQVVVIEASPDLITTATSAVNDRFRVVAAAVARSIDFGDAAAERSGDAPFRGPRNACRSFRKRRGTSLPAAVQSPRGNWHSVHRWAGLSIYQRLARLLSAAA